MPGSYVTEERGKMCEWNRLARVLCKLALDDEFVEYARERGYRVDRQVAHARLYVNVFLLS